MAFLLDPSTVSALSKSCLNWKVITALLFYVFFSLALAVNAQNRSEEVQTLLNFRGANAGPVTPEGHWSTWNESAETPCAWIGVTCTDNHTVWQLDFSGWGIFSINAQSSFDILSNLTDLRQLDLSSNEFGLQDDIGTLTQITRLDLSQNQLFGEIPPNISSCRSLRFLSLQQNELSGEIPSLSGLVNLQSLFLGGNFLVGPFPSEVGELGLLADLDLSNNSFNGTIPALPKLSNLVNLKLDYNNFTGFEDHWNLGPNSSLQLLSASFNELEGTIPANITGFLHLNHLDLSNNRLSGRIPSGFSNQYRNAFFLDLSVNQLSGAIPADMLLQQTYGNAAQTCASVNVSHNLLVDSIPIDGTNYLCLSFLDLSYNKLTGSIPVNLFTTADNYIDILRLQNNRLSGDIVDVMVEGLGTESCFYRTHELRAQNNLLTGDLSRIASTDNINLEVLDLGNNNLQWRRSKDLLDPINATLQQFTSTGFLTEFRAGGNNFSGTSLPAACFVSQALYIPSRQFNVLDLSRSHLQGEIVGAAFNSSCLPFLNFLDLSNNSISGSVPENVILLPSLTTFDVSNNNLSGALPPIPQTSLFGPPVFAGNPGLCGYPLAPCPQPDNGKSGGIPWWLLLIIIGASLIIAVGSVLVSYWRWRVYTRRHEQDEDLIKTLMERDAATLMSLRELRKATDNFVDSAQIGQGGFGIVYKGKLSDGTIVAIKRSKAEGSPKDKEQFLNEVRILSQVNHRNLVKLLGCCLENKIALLVLEYVSNGTLQEHLRGKIGDVRLSWKQRLKIAVQTADALNYLHTAPTFPIYHRDVKSANILLNDDLNAKVTDFGISKLAPLEATHVSTLAIHGTIGYIDPEYYTSYRLTDKSDVYSFGVVLLELISAKPAINVIDADGEKTGLVNFARSCIESGDLRSLVDPAIKETYNDPASFGTQSIINVGRVAMKCLDMQSKARPNMSEVLNDLQTLWLELLRTSKNLDPIIENDSEEDDSKDPRYDHMFLLSQSFSGDSSSFTLHSDSGSSSVQMSDFSSRESMKSRSMG